MTSGAPPHPRCPRCGHGPARSRFCPECGGRMGERTGAGRDGAADQTAERPRVVDEPSGVAETPDTPETSPWGRGGSSSAPPAARWPLYADEVTAAPGQPRPTPPVEPVEPVEPVVPMTGAAPAEDRGRRTVVPWVVGAVVVLLLAGGGAVLLLGGTGGLGAATGGSDDTGPRPAASDRDAGGRAGTPSTSAAPQPTLSASPSPRPVRPVDVSSTASVTASATAPPSTDVDGDRVVYDAANVLDGDPSTAWRAAGDGQGVELTLTLARPTVVTRLGLVNGYAKSEPGYDGYAANRRLTDVDWVLGDGTVVAQDGLGRTTSVQTVPVDDVRTRTITLRLRGTTAPGQVDGRDFTAISEVRVVGDPR